MHRRLLAVIFLLALLVGEAFSQYFNAPERWPALPPTPWTSEGALSLEWTCTTHEDASDPKIILSNGTSRKVLRFTKQLQDAIGEVSRWSGDWVRVEYTPDMSLVRTISVVPKWLRPAGYVRSTDWAPRRNGQQSPGPFQQGSKPFVTILAKFADRASESAPRSYYDNMFGNTFPAIGHYYRNVSNGVMNTDGSTVVGWITLPKTYAEYQNANGVLNFGLIHEDATAVVDSQIDFRNYFGINVCVNDGIGGGIWGLGGGIYRTLDGESRVWGATLNGPSHNQFLLIHEMGHAYGLRHYSSATQEYGSPYCPMGGGSRGDSSYGSRGIHYQMFQKWWLNWIPENRVYYGWPGSTQTIRLERRSDPTSNGYLMSRIFYGGYGSRYFVVEAIKGSTGGHDGEPFGGYVVISDCVEGANPKVVDANPASGGETDALYLGQTWEDVARGVKIRVLGEDATSFQVEVTVGPQVPWPHIVTNTNDSGPSCLREAMIFAKQFPSRYPQFNIPASDPNFVGGVATIKPTLSLPELNTQGVVINGLTQLAFGGDTNPNGPEIVLDGSLTGGYVSGLVLHGPRNVVRGLGIQNFTASGVYVYEPVAVSNVIDRCYIGVTSDGMAAAGCGWDGVTVASGAKNTWIGGATAAGNLISCNGRQIAVWDPGSDNTLIQSNFVGGNRTGTTGFTNGGGGIGIINGPKNTKVTANRVSGNQGAGIEVWGGGTDGTSIKGNRVGLNAAGTGPLPNTSAGIVISADGAATTAPQNTVVGGSTPTDRNVISGNSREGIWAGHASTRGLTISGNWVGLGSDGTSAVGNAFTGIAVDRVQLVKIGGVTSAEGNLCANNGHRGIGLWSVTDAFIQGNKVGFRVDNLPAGNTQAGIELSSCTRPRVGGTVNGTRNFVGNSGGNGIAFWGTSDGFIQGNTVGLTPNGLSAAKNNGDGILLASSSARNMVGGTVPSAVNVVGQCGGKGIAIWDAGSDGNKVYGNWIGVATNGTTNMPIGAEGIFIGNSARANIVGGQPLSYRNVVGNATWSAILLWKTNDNLVYGNWVGFQPGGAAAPCLAGGIILSDTSSGNRIINNFVGNVAGDGCALDNSSQNTIQGNNIGFAYGGIAAAPIGQRCLTAFNGSSNNFVGGVVSGQGNRFGNAQGGIGMWSAQGNTIQGNYFGLTKSNGPAGFTGDVVSLDSGSSDNWIGGTVLAARNVITGGTNGVSIWQGTSLRNRIRMNSIFGNRALGINLVGNDGAFGVTANDPLDADAGPNGLSNFPLIATIQTGATTLTVDGSLSALPNTTYTIDLFANGAGNTSFHGEGQTYLGSATVTTDAAGQAVFSATVPKLGGLHLAGTATDASGNTSEFGPTVART